MSAIVHGHEHEPEHEPKKEKEGVLAVPVLAVVNISLSLWLASDLSLPYAQRILWRVQEFNYSALSSSSSISSTALLFPLAFFLLGALGAVASSISYLDRVRISRVLTLAQFGVVALLITARGLLQSSTFLLLGSAMIAGFFASAINTFT